jgi:hypothetical protein
MCATTVVPRDLGAGEPANARELRRGMPRSRWCASDVLAARCAQAARMRAGAAPRSRGLPKERPDAARSCCVHRGQSRAQTFWSWAFSHRRARTRA